MDRFSVHLTLLYNAIAVEICLFARLSVCKTRAPWQNEIIFCPYSYIPYERPIILVFLTWKMVGGGRRLLRKILVQIDWPIPFRNADFQSIFVRSDSAVTRSEKSSVITNRKSTTGFLMSLRRTAYVVSKLPRGLKNAKWPFSEKILHFTKRKSALKFLRAKIVSSRVVRTAFLTVHKWLVGDVFLNVNFVRKVNHQLAVVSTAASSFWKSHVCRIYIGMKTTPKCTMFSIHP